MTEARVFLIYLFFPGFFCHCSNNPYPVHVLSISDLSPAMVAEIGIDPNFPAAPAVNTISLAPSNLTFVTPAPRESLTQHAFVINTTIEPITLNSITFAITNDLSATTGSCFTALNGDGSVSAGNFCQIDVQYTPQMVESITNTLNITYHDSTGASHSLQAAITANTL